MDQTIRVTSPQARYPLNGNPVTNEEARSQAVDPTPILILLANIPGFYRIITIAGKYK
ncbi:MAG: hypothetical protein MUO40_01225 [Anaerolineaceae bacterium]|nr:hypothetical protein [Anaerolineaceae bacterium]